MIEFSPDNENSAVERIEFIKDGKKITFVNRFDSYTVYAHPEEWDDTCEEWVNYDPDSEQGINTGCFGWIDEEEGERVEWEIEGDLTDDEREELIESFQENYESGPEALGWEWSDRDLFFYGPITISDSDSDDDESDEADDE